MLARTIEKRDKKETVIKVTIFWKHSKLTLLSSALVLLSAAAQHVISGKISKHNMKVNSETLIRDGAMDIFWPVGKNK